jgi:hypothetical protein
MQIALWFLVITISACAGPIMTPVHAEPSEGSSGEPTPALPKCMAGWYADSHTNKQEWRQACESVAAEEPNFNVDYARCLADWDPETQMTKREWHMSCARVVKSQPGAFDVPLPHNR